ncbi:MAG TPA: hypothetical protein VFD82_12250 [Planctomycetota bacterium]|nr:hypothetical protein [Planctomycetota bacterium]
MPKNKDLKRLVRARMAKTGESFTTARLHVLAKAPPRAEREKAKRTVTRAPVVSSLAADYEKLAGMKDATVEAKTGCTWERWVMALDHSGAKTMTHTEIAELVHKRWKVSGWWSQMITVGYERIRGRRDRNQRDGGYAVSKSRTFACTVDDLSAAFAPAARKQWLGGETVEPRKSVQGKVARWKRPDGSKVQVFFSAKGPGKAVAALQHDALSSRDDVERWRTFWTERFGLLAEWLAAHARRRSPTAV